MLERAPLDAPRSKPFRRRGRFALYQPDEHVEIDGLTLSSAALEGSASAYTYEPGVRLVRELVSAFDEENIDAILGRFDARGADARSTAALACRIWRSRVREVMRIEARRLESSPIMRAWVRLLDSTDHLLTIALVFDLDTADESWTARVPELPIRWFMTRVPWRRIASWDDACAHASALSLPSATTQRRTLPIARERAT